jgi:hypothetical protein
MMLSHLRDVPASCQCSSEAGELVEICTRQIGKRSAEHALNLICSRQAMAYAV